MEIFGIVPLELLLIVLIALIVLGPKELKNTAQKTAGWIKKIRQSEIWTSTKEVMDIPNQVMRETGLDKEIRELQNLTKSSNTGTVWQPTPLPAQINSAQPAKPEKENSIAPEKGLPTEFTPDEDSKEISPEDDK